MSRLCYAMQVALVALMLTAANAQSVTCELQLSCSTCLTQSGCGWAADMTQCYAGTASGPNFPFTSSNWIWGTASCPSSGGSPGGSCPYTTCASCIDNPNCAWDGISCIPGSNIGSVCFTPGSSGGSPGGSCSYTTCASCNSHSCFWDGMSCIPGSSVGVCWSDSGLVDDATGMSMGIIMVAIFVPVGICLTVTSIICWWYRRVYMVRRAAMVVTDAGLMGTTTVVTSPYVAVQTGPSVNTVVY